MNLDASHRRFVRWIAVVLVALVVEEAARYGLRVYSESVLRRGSGPIPVSKSISELALTYPNTLVVSDDERLTIEETVALAICDGAMPSYLMKRANPLAREQVWDVIQINDDGISAPQSASYAVLGNIGDDADAARMVEQLRTFSGVLNAADDRRVRAMIGALGTMGLRGVGTATKSLDEMSDVNYWKGRFQFKPDELMRDVDLPPELEIVCLVFVAQALWRNDELPPKFKQILAEIPNEKHRQTVAWRFDLIEPRRGVAEAIITGQKVPTEKFRQGLRTMYEQRDRILSSKSRAQREIWDSKYLHPWLRPRPLPK